MTKTEFLSASLPYNLKCQYCGVISYDIDCDGDDVNHQYGNKVALLKELRFYKKYWIAKCGVKSKALKRFNNGDGLLPIIRPIDSLTKECVQADYNDGKPFIPIIELLEIELEKSVCRKYWKPIAAHFEWKAVAWKTVNRTSCFGYSKGGAFFHTECGEYQYLYNYEKLFQQMLKWHFWPNMPENEEVVYVTDEFNPYK